MSDPVWVEAGIEVLAEACPEEPPRTWELLRTALDEGFRSIDDRLQNLGPLQPDLFNLNEAIRFKNLESSTHTSGLVSKTRVFDTARVARSRRHTAAGDRQCYWR